MTSLDPIYLDHNATTPLLPEVMQAMLPFLNTHFGNPSSGHPYGARAKAGVDRARQQVAALLGCYEDEIVFTSGGTEANNLAIFGVIAATSGRIVTSAIEHPATTRPVDALAARGLEVVRLRPDGDGRVSAAAARDAIDDATRLVTVMHANNETGVLQPIPEIAEAARARGIPMHTDAAQSAGKVPVRVADLGVDLLTVAAHKLYGPKGVGALYIRRGTQLAPLMMGAEHEAGRRPGTENVAAIVGLGAACAAASEALDNGAPDRVRRLTDKLWDRLRAAIPTAALNGDPERRLPNTLNVRFPPVSGRALLAAVPEVAASTGSACHGDQESPSEVLVTMGIDPTEALSSVRLTLGLLTSEAEVAAAASGLIRGYRQLTGATQTSGPADGPSLFSRA